MLVRKIKKSSAAQIVRRDLTRLIKEGHFKDGILPSEDNLAAMFGVSRITIRDALANLENLEYISRVQGKGTVINEAVNAISCRICEGMAFQELLKNNGYEVSIGRSLARRIPADPAVQKRLESKSPEMYYFEKLFLGDGKPAIFAVNYLLPEHIDERILSCPMDERSIFSLLEEEFDFPEVAYDIIDVNPCNADAAIASVLGVPEGTAILFMESLTVNKQQHPVMLNREYYHPDMLKFREVRNTLFR